ncbi:START domain-containing protein [Mucilaginibacter jinjuensis]|uniref:START domain-containing protein n=1 Tax=Mucilaginibacter jinjuensis TaxID=1176721 RepID=A0ABY7TCV3_9SPHI|nr:START domain-containing protein [Mucilaginibacter jinjuensis]WCT14038.1 START domain-containing protein [Mucilaginibacter jinjuensis]
MNKLLLTLTCIIFFAGTTYAQENWKLKTEDEGIKVYTRAVSNSNFKAVKVNCQVSANASQFVAVIMDIKNSVTWAYHTKSATVLKQVSPSELYYYSEVQVPWPVHNRDFICHIMVKQNPQTKVVTIDAPCLGDYIPEKDGIVRVKQSVGKWIITPIGKDKLDIEYTLALDPGGDVPAWLINLFAAEGPMQTFKKLKTQLQNPAYQRIELPYIVN